MGDTMQQRLTQDLTQFLASLPEDDRIKAINEIRMAIHQVSPFREEPVDCVLLVKNDQLGPNDYNPNNVAPPERKLLKKSIELDCFTQPIVVTQTDKNALEIVDGFHRYLVMKNSETIAEREGNCLPVSVIDRPLEDRIASTIRHNRARGTHSVELMTEIVQQLVEAGLSDRWIMTNIGMDKEELLRLKQLSGLASLFKGGEFSRSWEWDKEE